MQCDVVVYLRGVLSMIKPHLGSLLAKGSWAVHLLDHGPMLSISEDSPPPWGMLSTPANPGSTPQRPLSPGSKDEYPYSNAKNSEQHHGSRGQGLEPSQLAAEALDGVVRLGWLLTCRARLTRAWRATLSQGQQALMTSSFEVGSQLAAA